MASSTHPNNRMQVVASMVARVAIAFVFVVNVQCALSFVIWPQSFAEGFELAGVSGNVAVQGLGIAFLMWNATYPAVIVNPHRFRALYVVVLVQQVIGLIGESWLLFSLPAGHRPLASSIELFISFDALGLVLMAGAFIFLVLAHRPKRLA